MGLYMIFRTAWRSLTVNKMRSVLTALGIIIGVASVILMVSLSQGATSGITERIAANGTNVLMIRAEGGRGAMRGAGGSSLTLEDVQAIALLPYVKEVAPEAETNVTATAGSSTWSTTVDGTTPATQVIKGWKLTEGGFFTQDDVDNSALVAVIGSTVAESLFPGGNGIVGSNINLNGLAFTVIGVLPAQGAGGMGGDQDNIIYIPLSTAGQRLLGSDDIDMITVQATKQEALSFLQDAITATLRENHRLADDAEDDFRIMDMAELLATIEDTTRILSLLLGGIAAVSLIVGGIGVMNIMLVSVTERTREIGIRIAVGATSHDIQSQFLIESALLCVIGGASGTALGWGLSALLGRLLGWNMSVPLWAAGMAIIFSTLVGLIFGYYPARKAAEADPIEALRYE